MILPEFDHEMANTRKVLERVPDDKLEWKAHPKSNSIGWNASHLAEIPGWATMALTTTEFDIHPQGGEPYRTVQLGSRREILEAFDKSVAEARKAIENASDEDVGVIWTLKSGGEPLMPMPRAAVVRGWVLNHTIHHRAHLCVYLRLNDIPVPGMYGPSGDDA
jgi:uncharacterized damage-inducible protein DinB